METIKKLQIRRLIGNVAENSEYLERFERGELLNLLVVVEASLDGEEAWDALGACHVRANHLENDIQEVVDQHGMVDASLNELDKAIIEKAKTLTQYLS